MSDNGYPIKGTQETNEGWTDSDTYLGDPTTEAVPDSHHREHDIGVVSWTIAKIKELFDFSLLSPTQDQKDALDAANAPSSINAVATIDDLAASASPTVSIYDFRTATGVPAAGEIMMNNVDPTLATFISLHNLNRAGVNTSNTVLALGAGDAIIIQEITDGDKSYNFDITGAGVQTGGTGASGYITFPVTFFSQGSTPLADSDISLAAMYPDGANDAHLSVLNNLSDLNSLAAALVNLGLAPTSAVAFATQLLEVNDTGTNQLTINQVNAAGEPGLKLQRAGVDTLVITSDSGNNTILTLPATGDEFKFYCGAVRHMIIGNSSIAMSKALKAQDATDSTSIGSGAIIVTGGISCAKQLRVAGLVTLDGGLVVGGDLSKSGSAFHIKNTSADLLAFFTNNLQRVTIAADGTATFTGAVEAQNGNVGLTVGADAGANTLTDATNKEGRVGAPHYTNAEQPMTLVYGQTTSTKNHLDVGGGTTSMNAATDIRFYTAANNTTTSGLERMLIAADGDITMQGQLDVIKLTTLRPESSAGTGLKITAADGDRALDFQVPADGDDTAPFVIQTGNSLALEVDSTVALTITPTSRVRLDNVPSGATQVAAGAAINEVWKTASHATLPDNVMMIGV